MSAETFINGFVFLEGVGGGTGDDSTTGLLGVGGGGGVWEITGACATGTSILRFRCISKSPTYNKQVNGTLK